MIECLLSITSLLMEIKWKLSNIFLEKKRRKKDWGSHVDAEAECHVENAWTISFQSETLCRKKKRQEKINVCYQAELKPCIWVRLLGMWVNWGKGLGSHRLEWKSPSEGWMSREGTSTAVYIKRRREWADLCSYISGNNVAGKKFNMRCHFPSHLFCKRRKVRSLHGIFDVFVCDILLVMFKVEWIDILKASPNIPTLFRL